MNLPKDGQIQIFILLHKSQLDVSQEEGVGVSGKRQIDVIRPKLINESSLKTSKNDDAN